MTWSPIGAYEPGSSPLHRMRPGVKLLTLIILAVVLMWVREWWITASALALVFFLTLVARITPTRLLRQIRGFIIVAVLLLAFNWWQRGSTLR